MEDISCGLERMPIPYESSGTSPQDIFPAKFRYVRRSIPGPDCARELFEEQLCGCSCSHGCHQDTCSCLTRFGPSYHPHTSQMISDAVTTSSLKPVIECNSQCACATTCSNRLVQHGPKVKLKVGHAGSRGFGLFACEDIQRLTFVCEYAGEVVGPCEARKRIKAKDGGMNYLIVLREHCASGTILTCVDPEHVGNVGRFVNHSCDPNMLMVPIRVDNSIPKLALFARRNICAGDELTFDYSGESVLGEVSPLDKHPSVVQTQTDKCDSGLLVHSRRETKSEKNVDVTVIKDDPDTLKKSSATCAGVDCCTANANVSETVDCKVSNTCKSSANVEYIFEKNNSISEAYVPVGTNMRKRKRMHAEVNSDTEKSSCYNMSQEKQLVGSDTRTSQITLKVCLCGTTLCKGYLPFDQQIFETS